MFIPWGMWYIIRMIIFFINLILLKQNLKYRNDKIIGEIINLQIILATICILTVPYYFISIRFIYIFNHISIFILIYDLFKKDNKFIIVCVILATIILYGSYQILLFKESIFDITYYTDWINNIFNLLK